MMTKTRDALAIIAMENRGPVEDIGIEAAKRMPTHARFRYSQPVTYELSDGTLFETAITALTKPKLKKAIEANHRYINNRQMWADQWQFDGQPPIWSVSTRFTIDLR